MSDEPITVAQCDLERTGSAQDGTTYWVLHEGAPHDGVCMDWSDWLALARRILEREGYTFVTPELLERGALIDTIERKAASIEAEARKQP